MVNWDKNTHGAKLRARRQAWETAQKAKEQQREARLAERKAKIEVLQRELLENLVADPDFSERQAYSGVFDNLCSEGPVSVFDPQFLRFVIQHTDIGLGAGHEELRDALQNELKRGQEYVSFDEFLDLLRNNALSDSTAVTSFLEVCGGYDSIAMAEAKAHMLHVAQHQLCVSFPKETWDVVVPKVIDLSETMIDAKQYIQYCKKLARFGRLMEFIEADDDEDVQAMPHEAWLSISMDMRSLLWSSSPARTIAARKAGVAVAAGGNAASERDLGRLPPVALKCSLCLAAKGICSYHVSLPPGNGIDTSGEPIDGLMNSEPPGSRASHAKVVPGTVPTCDLCKVATGGVCSYHTKSRTEQGTGAGCDGNTRGWIGGPCGPTIGCAALPAL